MRACTKCDASSRRGGAKPWLARSTRVRQGAEVSFLPGGPGERWVLSTRIRTSYFMAAPPLNHRNVCAFPPPGPRFLAPARSLLPSNPGRRCFPRATLPRDAPVHGRDRVLVLLGVIQQVDERLSGDDPRVDRGGHLGVGDVGGRHPNRPASPPRGSAEGHERGGGVKCEGGEHLCRSRRNMKRLPN